jgi:hypothetical protein
MCSGVTVTIASPPFDEYPCDASCVLCDPPTPSFNSIFGGACTFFLNSALRSEYPRFRDVGESGDREAFRREPSLPPSGATSCVSILRSGVPGLPCCALSMPSVEKRTRCETSDSSLDVDGRAVSSTADVCAEGGASVRFVLAGASIVCASFEFIAYGSSPVAFPPSSRPPSSSSCAEERLLLIPAPSGVSPAPDMSHPIYSNCE